MRVAKNIGEVINEDYADILLEPFSGGKSSLYYIRRKEDE